MGGPADRGFSYGTIRAAAEIFGALGATPALAETDELLRQATAITPSARTDGHC